MKKRNQKALIQYLFIVVLRIGVPLLIFYYPIFSALVVTFLDIIDADFASNRVLSLKEYERYDKILDLWWYTMAIVYSVFYLKPYFVFLLFLYLYRLAGDIIFFIKNDRRLLFFFQNFFENAFFVVFFGSLVNGLRFIISGSNLYLTLIIAFMLKIFQEWLVHWKQFTFKKNRLWLKN